MNSILHRNQPSGRISAAMPENEQNEGIKDNIFMEFLECFACFLIYLIYNFFYVFLILSILILSGDLKKSPQETKVPP